MALFGNKNSIKFFTARVLNSVLDKESLLSEEISKIPKGSFNTIWDIEFSFMGKGVDGTCYAKTFNNHIKYYPFYLSLFSYVMFIINISFIIDN